MKVLHCKKAGSEPKERFLENSRHWPAANIRTNFISNKIDNAKPAAFSAPRCLTTRFL